MSSSISLNNLLYNVNTEITYINEDLIHTLQPDCPIFEKTKKVTKLQLGRQLLTDSKISALMRFNWDKVDTLQIYGNQLTLSIIQHLSKLLKQLRQINIQTLSFNKHSYLIFHYSDPKKVESFYIKSMIDLRGLRCIQERGVWSNLKNIDLSHNSLNNKSGTLIIRINMPLVQYLYLSNNKFTNQFVKILIKANWPCLYSLDVTDNRFSADFFKFFCQINMPKLSILDLYQLNVLQAGLVYFAKIEHRLFVNYNESGEDLFAGQIDAFQHRKVLHFLSDMNRLKNI